MTFLLLQAAPAAGNDITTLILVLLGFFVMGLLIARSNRPITAKSNWQHFFPDMKFSAEEFYGRVTEGIKGTELAKITIGRESFLERHIFSARREYLRLKVNEYIFYVCAAPFGTGTFVSWWLCETDPGTINRIPIVSKLLGLDRGRKTFYQVDTEAMYKSAIHFIVTSVTEEYGNTHGSRMLTDHEMQYK